MSRPFHSWVGSSSTPGEHEDERAFRQSLDVVGEAALERQELIGTELDDAIVEADPQVAVEDVQHRRIARVMLGDRGTNLHREYHDPEIGFAKDRARGVFDR